MAATSANISCINRVASATEVKHLVRSVVLMMRVWDLSDATAVAILGGMQTESWFRWKAGVVEIVDRERTRRMIVLTDIHLALRSMSGPLGSSDWLRKRRNEFAGRSALQLMASGVFDDLLTVRDAIARPEKASAFA